MSSQLISNLFVVSSTAPVPGWTKDEGENERNLPKFPTVVITVEHGLLEEITTFVSLCSGSFMPLIWGKNDKPGQPSEHDVLGHQSPVAHESWGGPSQCTSLVLCSYRFLRIQQAVGFDWWEVDFILRF